MIQLVFLLFLLVGQVVLLGLWQVARRRPSVEAVPAANRLVPVGFALYWLAGQVVLLVGWTMLLEGWKSADTVDRADLVICLHFGFMVVVLALQLLILVGWPLGWKWTRSFSLRLLHLVCIEIVVGQAVVALECPLTSLERDLRGEARGDREGDKELTWAAFYSAQLHYLEGASPLARFCHHSLLYPIPRETYPYVVAPFGLLVFLTWVCVPPRMPGP